MPREGVSKRISATRRRISESSGEILLDSEGDMTDILEAQLNEAMALLLGEGHDIPSEDGFGAKIHLWRSEVSWRQLIGRTGGIA